MKQSTFIGLIFTILVSCGPSTKIEKSWHDPGSSIDLTAQNKVLILGMVKDETSRRVVEDQVAKRMNGKGVASYTILTSEMLKDTTGAILNEKLNEGKFTHILLMRLADVEKETSYVPGTSYGYYGGYRGYYGYGAGMYGTEGYYTTDKNYFVETAVYSINPDKLLWTGTTKTVNPSKMEQTVNAIADVVSDKMKKDGFIK